MNLPFDTEWSNNARLTFDRLPIEVQDQVQAELTSQVPQLARKYSGLAQRRPGEQVSVGTISHLNAPNWGIWLCLETEYAEDEIGHFLFVYELEELTNKEFEQSRIDTKSRLSRINPSHLI